jgi:hypothetical protein
MSTQKPVIPGRERTSPTRGLSIAAIILSVLMAPVGLVLGIVAARRGKREDGAAGGLAISAIIVGSVLTVLNIAVVIGVLVFTASVVNNAQRQQFCAQFAGYPTLESDLTVIATNIPGPEGTDPDAAYEAINRILDSGALDSQIGIGEGEAPTAQLTEALDNFRIDLVGMQDTLYPNDEGLYGSYLGGDARSTARLLSDTCF